MLSSVNSLCALEDGTFRFQERGRLSNAPAVFLTLDLKLSVDHGCVLECEKAVFICYLEQIACENEDFVEDGSRWNPSERMAR